MYTNISYTQQCVFEYIVCSVCFQFDTHLITVHTYLANCVYVCMCFNHLPRAQLIACTITHTKCYAFRYQLLPRRTGNITLRYQYDGVENVLVACTVDPGCWYYIVRQKSNLSSIPGHQFTAIPHITTSSQGIVCT